ncbi:putative cytokinetic ring protein SteA [Aeromicrobium piscarium]|uniref:SteA-like C-terminal domain-containing protein n=1 Tax=Aeromicrobium piscarium TaxID=2590901 RepID=A0A554RKB3_9ACTN|nr:putative cytokinetic ring protein SteA [Aeromicrobium piscarium]TSD54510.1 hypothetical protein FNM00_17335 [Aeromicrobium piscarium]
MALLKRNRVVDPDAPGVRGPARIARQSSDFAGVRAGDVVVIDLPDLEVQDAEVLVAREVAAVVNVAPSSTGRYPNLGPQVLTSAGIHLVDDVGEGLFARLRSGEQVRVEGSAVFRGEELLATGIEMTGERISEGLTQASTELSNRLDSVTANASDQLRRERAMLFEGARIPRLQQSGRGRAAVIVADTFDVEDDLKGMRRFIRDNDPLLIGVGKGGDVIAGLGLVPHVVIGTDEQLTNSSIDKAREAVVVSPAGRLDHPERFEQHGTNAMVFAASGASEDLAILLADHNDADVIVLAGAPPTLVALLERDTADVGSAFVARLKAGTKVVDAKAVRFFAVQRLTWLVPFLLLLAGVVAVIAAVLTTPAGQVWWTDLRDLVGSGISWIEGLFS